MKKSGLEKKAAMAPQTTAAVILIAFHIVYDLSAGQMQENLALCVAIRKSE